MISIECSLALHGLPRKNRWVWLSVGVCFASVCGPRKAASKKEIQADASLVLTEATPTIPSLQCRFKVYKFVKGFL